MINKIIIRYYSETEGRNVIAKFARLGNHTISVNVWLDTGYGLGKKVNPICISHDGYMDPFTKMSISKSNTGFFFTWGKFGEIDALDFSVVGDCEILSYYGKERLAGLPLVLE